MTASVSDYLDPAVLFEYERRFLDWITSKIFSMATVDLLYGLMYLFAIFFIALIIYSVIRTFEVRHKEHEHMHHLVAGYARNKAERERKAAQANVSTNPRWNQVLGYVFSPSESDWKLGIMEADSMLETLLEQLGFMGVSIGERLKAADPDQFPNLAIAWEAHAVRNRIAHEGLSFVVTQREAKRVIALYERIFKDYGFV